MRDGLIHLNIHSYIISLCLLNPFYGCRPLRLVWFHWIIHIFSVVQKMMDSIDQISFKTMINFKDTLTLQAKVAKIHLFVNIWPLSHPVKLQAALNGVLNWSNLILNSQAHIFRHKQYVKEAWYIVIAVLYIKKKPKTLAHMCGVERF